MAFDSRQYTKVSLNLFFFPQVSLHVELELVQYVAVIGENTPQNMAACNKGRTLNVPLFPSRASQIVHLWNTGSLMYKSTRQKKNAFR